MRITSTRGFASALVLSGAVLGACDPQAEPIEPYFAASVEAADAPAATSADAGLLAELREVTARFHNMETAVAAGYETQITPCWAHHSAGAMGYHYGNTNLLDAKVDLLEPEVVMYEPQPGGHMRLVGMEYIVPLAAWEEAGHDLDDPADVPELLGQEYTRHSFLPIFKLHIWLWRQNPAGVFADWNSNVTCAHAESTEVF
ncbi:MAG TPA: hypothetical protein VK912_03850 [Longimicrobiales bacterium]|nr:hypothetical protein [Longimicrobiales bacterium]